MYIMNIIKFKLIKLEIYCKFVSYDIRVKNKIIKYFYLYICIISKCKIV